MNRGWKRITVDVTDLEGARSDARAYGVELTVINEFGPGGGNPEVRLYGPKQQVIELLKSWGYNERGEA